MLYCSLSYVIYTSLYDVIIFVVMNIMLEMLTKVVEDLPWKVMYLWIEGHLFSLGIKMQVITKFVKQESYCQNINDVYEKPCKVNFFVSHREKKKEWKVYNWLENILMFLAFYSQIEKSSSKYFL